MTVMELAAELGKEIKKDERIIRLNKAHDEYDKDTALLKAIMEYNVQSKALSEEYKREEKDEELIKIIEEHVKELYKQITENPHMTAVQEAEAAVNEFMNEVNGEITYQITGERPCTHDCSTCGGSCHH